MQAHSASAIWLPVPNRVEFKLECVAFAPRRQLFYTGPNDLNPAEMEDLFNPVNLQPGDPSYFTPAPGANDEFRTVPSTTAYLRSVGK